MAAAAARATPQMADEGGRTVPASTVSRGPVLVRARRCSCATSGERYGGVLDRSAEAAWSAACPRF